MEEALNSASSGQAAPAAALIRPHHAHLSRPCPPAACRYGWRWDASYQEIKYEFTDLDKTTMSNISSRSPSLWAHAVVTWVVSLIMYFWLWK